MIRPMHLISGFLAAMVFAAVAATVTADSPTTVQIRDDCDAPTFNAAIGPGTCNPNAGGDTIFQAFVADVLAQQSVDPWRFNPDQMSEPRPIVAHNRGGETHTFTRVAEFGDGSIAPPLNNLLGKAPGEDVAPECLADATGPHETFVPSGGDRRVNDVRGGDKFQCCIHPWMRTTVRSR
jgi:hypothetical protein